MRSLLEERIQRAIDERVFPGCTLGIIGRGGERFVQSFGALTYEEDAPLVTRRTLYDCASVTKSIPLAFVVLTLIDNGELDLDEKIVKYLPEFATSDDKVLVTLRHLLTYTLDLDVPASNTLADRGADVIINTMLTALLRRAPGTSFLYANSTAILLGLLLHRVTGRYVDVLGEEYFFEPLSMKHTTFHPEELADVRIAPTEKDVPLGVVHDEATRVLQDAGYYLGAAGLFSTAEDLLRFADMILAGGEYDGKRYLSHSLVYKVGTDQGAGSGLGWQLSDVCIGQTFGKTGFTGTSLYMNLETKTAAVVLSNRVYPTRPNTDTAINQVRHDIMEIVCTYHENQ